MLLPAPGRPRRLPRGPGGAGLPIGVLNAPEDLFEDEHLQARKFFVPVEQPGHGEFLRPGRGVPVLGVRRSPGRPPHRRLGQHTEAVLGRAGIPR